MTVASTPFTTSRRPGRLPLERPASPPLPKITWKYFVPIILFLAVIFGLAQILVEVAAVAFLVGYAVMCYTRPDRALVIMLASAPFNQEVPGGLPVKLSLSDICLVIATPIFAFRWMSSGGRIARNPMLPSVAAYLLLCILSTAAEGFSKEAITSVVQMTVYLVLAIFFFANFVEPIKVLPALYGLLVTNAFLAICVGANGSPYIFGLHKNAVGSSLAVATVLALELWFRRHSAKEPTRLATLALVINSMGLLLTLSRGAWVGAIAGGLVLMMLRRQFKLLAKFVALASPLVIILWALMPDSSKEYAFDLNASAMNINARWISIDYAMMHFYSSPIFGVGVGLRKMYDATNLFMSTLAETGILGVITFFSMFIALAAMIHRGQKRLNRDEIHFSMLAIGAALMTAKLLHGMADHYWSRGALPIFAAAGLAVGAYNVSIKRKGRPTPQPAGRVTVSSGPARTSARPSNSPIDPSWLDARPAYRTRPTTPPVASGRSSTVTDAFTAASVIAPDGSPASARRGGPDGTGPKVSTPPPPRISTAFFPKAPSCAPPHPPRSTGVHQDPV